MCGGIGQYTTFYFDLGRKCKKKKLKGLNFDIQVSQLSVSNLSFN